jgi:hypothetical protein
MAKLRVIVDKLNKRKGPVSDFSVKNIIGVVNKGFTFESTNELTNSLGKWYTDNDGYCYWAGGLETIEIPTDRIRQLNIKKQLLSQILANTDDSKNIEGAKSITKIINSISEEINTLANK